MRVDTLARIAVIASMLMAVAAGLWPLMPQPALAAATFLTFGLTAALAWWRPQHAATIVLGLAYVSYGVVRALAGSAWAGVPFWLAAFAGLVLGSVSWRRWHASSPWREALAWWAVGVAVSWPVVAARELDFTFVPTFASSPIVTAALLQMSVALWMDAWLWSGEGAPFTVHVRRASIFESVPSWVPPLIVGASCTAVAAIYQRAIDPAWMSGEPWTLLGRVPGLMGDANPMGVAAALWAPIVVTIAAIDRFAPRSRSVMVAGVVAAGLLATAAWLSGARSTIPLLGCGLLGLGLAWYRFHGASWKWSQAVGGAALLAAVAAIAIVGARSAPESPVGRLLGSVSNRSPAAVVREVLWRRDGYGLAGIEAFKERPLNGIGIGRFASLAPAYAARAEPMAIPPDNAQNLWRHVLAERGLLGLLPVVWLTWLTITALRGESNAFGLLIRASMIGLGLTLVVGLPVQDPAIAMTAGMLAAYLGVSRATRQKPSPHGRPWAWALILACSLVGAALDGIL